MLLSYNLSSVLEKAKGIIALSEFNTIHENHLYSENWRGNADNRAFSVRGREAGAKIN